MLIRRVGDEDWQEPATTTYASEGELQKLIAASPSLIPGIDDGPAAVARELEVPGVGAADLVVVDPAGEISIVECKLASNAEIRRKVIGQVFAYAAGLAGTSFEELLGLFENRGASLIDACREAKEWDEEEFRDIVASNLAQGAFRLVIAVDSITEELKRTVVYINRHTSAAVRMLALELRRAADHGIEVLLPESFGEESAAEKAPPGRRRWDEPSLLSAIRAKHPDAVGDRMVKLYEFMREEEARLAWGRGLQPSVTARLGISSGRPVSVGFYPGYGVAINFDFVRESRSRDDLGQLLAAVGKVPGASQHLAEVEEADYRVRPTLPAEEVLGSDEGLEALKRAILESAS
jgi:hypothetical protein